MTDSGSLNAHTFLSRVLGNASPSTPKPTSESDKRIDKDKRQQERTRNARLSQANAPGRFFPFGGPKTVQDVEQAVPFLSDDQTEMQYSNTYSYMDDKIMKNMLMSEVSLNGDKREKHRPDMGGTSLKNGGSQKKNGIQSNNSINLNSESEDSSDAEGYDESDEEDAHNNSVEYGEDRRIPTSVNMNAIPVSEKEKIRRALELELELNDGNDDVSDGAEMATNNIPESLYIHSRHNDHGNIANRIEQSIMYQMKEVERKLGPTINNIGKSAKRHANDLIEHSILQPAAPDFISNKHYSKKNITPEDGYDTSHSATDVNRKKNVFTARKLPPKDRALWMWANIVNLDIFLTDVYYYYIGNGWNCIVLSRLCDLLTVGFVIWLTSFLGNCIDYSILFNEDVTKLSQVYDGKCYAKIPLTQKIFFYAAIVLLLMRLRNLYKEFSDLKEIKLFYNYLLDIDDSELQTISWPTVVKKIMILKNQNTNAIMNDKDNDLKSKAKLNAHDIANRLMRKENYMIAIFNRNILNKPLTIPFINTHFLTKTLEWNLKLCIFDYLFNEQGQIKSKVLSQHHRLSLIVNLRKRFRLAGLLSIALSPILVVYFILYYFLKLFYDYKTNPGLLNARSYSPLAKWKMREYNELPHLFDQRLNLSIEYADEYLNQFPKEFSDILLKFISYITGSIVTVLALLTIIDHENFLNFEITEGKTSLFYMSTLGAIFTVCKSAISNTDSRYLFNPEVSLKKVSHFTHFLPISWQNRYHTIEVKNQFCDLYNLKLILIFKELCSLIFLPYILYVSLPNSCDKIIDFFRDYSVHVDGIGYVCTFAMFNMNEDKDHVKSDNEVARFNGDADDKMMKSYIYFMESYGQNDVKNSPDKKELKNKDAVSFRNPTQTLLRRNINMNGNTSLLKSTLVNHGRRPLAEHVNGNDLTFFEEEMEDTKPDSYSAHTQNYLNELNNSMILGESFQLGNTKPSEGNRGTSSASDNYMENDIDDTSGGGVLGLLNQVYKHK